MRLAVTDRGNSQRTCLVRAPIHAESFGLGIRITGFWSANQMEIILKTGSCFVPVLLEPLFRSLYSLAMNTGDITATGGISAGIFTGISN